MDPAGNKKILLETFTVFGISVMAIYLARLLGNPDITGITIVVFCLIVPFVLLEKKKRDLKEYGLAGIDWKKGILWGLGAALILMPLFSLLYISIHLMFPGHIRLVSLAYLESLGPAVILKSLFFQALMNILFVGVTEEVLYRGYIQTNLNRIWGKPWRLFGIQFGFSIFETSFLFAVPHILWWGGNPLGLLVFFPSLLFALLREKTGSFVASALFHGICNLTLFTLNGFTFSG